MKKWIALTAFVMALFCLTVCSAEGSVAAGDIVTFGHYEQDNDPDNGPEPIEWIVLDVQDGKALLISRYGLESRTYNRPEYTDISWETCTLRIWLNNEFLNAAFSAEEQSAILVTEVDNSADQCYSDWNTSGGNNTQDRVFLLSFAEANRYLGVTRDDVFNMKSRVSPTEYAIQSGANVSGSYETADGKPAGWWLLRSPGVYQYSAAYVDSNSTLNSTSISSLGGLVRPAFWADLNANIFN